MTSSCAYAETGSSNLHKIDVRRSPETAAVEHRSIRCLTNERDNVTLLSAVNVCVNSLGQIVHLTVCHTWVLDNRVLRTGVQRQRSVVDLVGSVIRLVNFQEVQCEHGPVVEHRTHGSVKVTALVLETSVNVAEQLLTLRFRLQQYGTVERSLSVKTGNKTQRIDLWIIKTLRFIYLNSIDACRL
jgi:hypothetical protein